MHSNIFNFPWESLWLLSHTAALLKHSSRTAALFSALEPTPAGRPWAPCRAPGRAELSQQGFCWKPQPRGHRAPAQTEGHQTKLTPSLWEIRARETKQSRFQRPHAQRTPRTNPSASWLKWCSLQSSWRTQTWDFSAAWTHLPWWVLMLDKDYSEQQNCIQTELRDFIPWISLGSAHLVSVAALNHRLQHFWTSQLQVQLISQRKT